MDTPNEYYKAMVIDEGRIIRLMESDSYSLEKPFLENVIELDGYIFPGLI